MKWEMLFLSLVQYKWAQLTMYTHMDFEEETDHF